MKKYLISALVLVSLTPLSSFAATQSQFVVDCWQAKNKSKITVDFRINTGEQYDTVVRLAPGKSVIFPTPLEGYNPRVDMIGTPWTTWWYPMDCRTGYRLPDPKWYTKYIKSL